jgi:RND family efflux transporter MFP subunit
MQEQAERELEAAQSSLADAEANVTAMQADIEYWKAEIAREEKLYQARAVSTEEYQRELAQSKTAQAKLTQAQAAVQEKRALLSASKAKIRQAAAAITGAEARLDQVRSDILSAQSEVTANAANVNASQRRIQQRSAMAGQTAAQERTAGIVRGYTELRARQDGVVTERLVSPGTLVQPGMAILRIKNTDRLRLQANVAESDVSGIRIGNPVTVTTQRDPNFRLQTRVTSIFNAANPQSRTVIVEALVSNPGNRLLPGQYVVMQIATAASRRVLTIPQTAVRRDVDQKPYVWVADGQEGKPVAKRVNLTLGAADGQRIVVQTGLDPGDKVVYAGQEYLNEGDMLTLTEWTAQGPKTLPEGSGQMAPMPGMDMGHGNAMPGMKMDGKPDMEGMPGMKKDDRKGMPERNHSTMPGMNHGNAPSSGSEKMPDMPGMDHSKMPDMGGR